MHLEKINNKLNQKGFEQHMENQKKSQSYIMI